MRRLFLLLFIFNIVTSNLYAQDIEANLLVKVVDAPERDSLGSAFYRYKLNIIQDLDVSTFPCDTLFLNLETTGFFQTLKGEGTTFTELIPDMAVYSKKKRKYSKTNFSFNGVNLTIPIKEHKHIRIEYGYYSDLCFRTHIPYMSCGLLQFDALSNSWYFTTTDNAIMFSDVQIVIPDEVEFFANCQTIEEKNNHFSFELTRQKYKDLSFYIVDEKWFERHTFDVDSVKTTLFLSKRDTATTLNQLPTPLCKLPLQYTAERKEQITESIASLNSLFPDSGVRELAILEDIFNSSDKKYAYGKAVLTSEQQQFIFVDHSFWGKDLVHELVHCYMNYNYEKIDARYFFDESLIEYLACYVYYTDATMRDHAFMNKIEYYLQLPADNNLSIFDIKRNHVQTETGGGTFGIIYYKVPFLIHQFARKIGEDKFISAVTSFNSLVKEGVSVKFEDFGVILQDSGVSKEEWLKFRNSL